MSNTQSPVTTVATLYADQQALSSINHANWRLKDGDMAFASAMVCVPLGVSELALAGRHYPILFGETTRAPMALLGLDAINLFVQDGQWDKDAYVPAYIRRYPFATVLVDDGENSLALLIDASSERIVKEMQTLENDFDTPQGVEETVALFEGGTATEFTNGVLDFCQAFHQQALLTEDFSQVLRGADVLIERRADVTMNDGNKLGIDGFRIVDPKLVDAMSDSALAEWHRKGWLAAVQFHLASLDRFADLVGRRALRQHQ